MAHAISYLKELEKSSLEESIPFILGLRGTLERVVGRYRDSLKTIQSALKIAETKNNLTLMAANKLRLAI